VPAAAASAPAPAAAPAATAPAAAPAATSATPAAPAKAELIQVVEQAGMQWVETDRSKLVAAQEKMASAAPVKLGREPKVRPAVADEPLVQVETRG
jgi:ribonuclease E